MTFITPSTAHVPLSALGFPLHLLLFLRAPYQSLKEEEMLTLPIFSTKQEEK